MSLNKKWDPAKDASVIDGCIANSVIFTPFELNEMVVVGLNKIYDTRFRQDYLEETCDSFLKMLEINDDRLKNESWIKQFNCKESDTWPIDRNLLSWIDAALSVRHSIACHGCPDIVTDAVYIDRIKEAMPGLKTELIVSIIETFQVWYLSTAYEKKWLKKND